MNNKPSKSLTFFLSMVPGLGHFYLRAMTRGLQFMILFFGSFFVMDFLPLRMFPFWIPVIWFYSLFDALQVADMETLEDRPLVEWKYISKNLHWVGYALIVFGAMIIVDNFLPQLWRIYVTEISWYNVRSLIMAAFFIVAGIVMLRGKKVKARD